jgi:hypothetical protein
VSNAIRYDPLLVHYLARELDGLLRGRACASAPYFAAGRVAMLPLDRGEALELDLHPRRGWIRLVPWEGDGYEADAFCRGVEAPRDERRLTIRIEAPDRFRGSALRLEVELMTNQWNVLLVSDEDGRIHSALWGRAAGERSLHPGAVYRPPTASERVGAGAVGREEASRAWEAELGGVVPAERARALVRGFAWTGTLNSAAVLGEAVGGEERRGVGVAGALAGEAEAAAVAGGAAAVPREAEAVAEAAGGRPGGTTGGAASTDGRAAAGHRAELAAAFERWWALRALPPARPVLLTRGSVRQPYPLAMEGWAAEPVRSLLEAMERVAGAAGDGAAEAEAPEEALLPAVRLRLEAAERRVRRLEEQREREGEVERLRAQGDLLLAKLHEVPRGVAEVVLAGWEGEEVRIPLDPGLSPAENAAARYAEARKRERAAERLPALIEAAEAEAERWRRAVAAGERGELPEWVAGELARGADGRGRTAEGESLPYRVFRSSGGLEIRVGRSSKANDQLTFGHSAPNDVWLHARSVPGSHVILRWRDPEGAPPARDLEEAARLAAHYSKARSSGIVPVDWTRRKYVRKPRGAPPGSVIPQRVRTLFVEPGVVNG